MGGRGRGSHLSWIGWSHWCGLSRDLLLQSLEGVQAQRQRLALLVQGNGQRADIGVLARQTFAASSSLADCLPRCFPSFLRKSCSHLPCKTRAEARARTAGILRGRPPHEADCHGPIACRAPAATRYCWQRPSGIAWAGTEGRGHWCERSLASNRRPLNQAVTS